jgi:hypothetical protein
MASQLTQHRLINFSTCSIFCDGESLSAARGITNTSAFGADIRMHDPEIRDPIFSMSTSKERRNIREFPD